MEWDVTLDLDVDADQPLEEIADDLVGLLSGTEGVVSIAGSILAVAISIDAADANRAVARATERIRDAFATLRLPSSARARIVGVAAKRADLVAAELDRPTFPEIVGVAEVAELLGVSKQRITELRTSGRLPSPIADLRAGPVWPKAAIERWLEGWERKPGRPRKIVAAVPHPETDQEMRDARRLAIDAIDEEVWEKWW